MDKTKEQSKVEPEHIGNLMETDRIVVRIYRGKKLLEKFEHNPWTLREYLSVLDVDGFWKGKQLSLINKVELLAKESEQPVKGRALV